MTTVWTRRLAGLALLAWIFSGCSLILDTDSLKTGDAGASEDSRGADSTPDAPLAEPGITVKPTQGHETTEGGGKANFTMVFESQPTATVRVAITSSDSTKGTVSPAELTFTAINWDTPQAVTVTGQNNDAATGNQTYQVSFSVSSGDADYDDFSVPALTITHIDDDDPGITISPSLITTHEGDEPEDAKTIEVYINTQPSAAVTITPTGNTDEGTITPTSLVFAVGEFGPENKKTFSVQGKPDGVVDGDQTYDIAFASTSSDATYNNRDDIGTVEVTNIDEDAANATIEVDPASGETTEGGGTQLIEVTLGAKPAVNVVVAVVSSNTDEGTVLPAELTFTTNNWNVAQEVTVTGRAADAAVNPDVNYQIRLTAAAASNPFNGKTAEVAMTGRDLNAHAIRTTAPNPDNETNESGSKEVTFQVRLGSQPSADIVVAASIAGASPGAAELVGVSTPHTFTQAGWNTAWTITVRGVPDGVAAGDRNYDVQLAVTNANGDTNYAGLDRNVAMVTLDDGKEAQLTGLTPADATIVDDGVETVTFTLKLTQAPSDDVTVDISLDPDTGLVTFAPTSPITLTSANYQTGVEVTITGEQTVTTGSEGVAVEFAISSSDPSYDVSTLADVDVTLTAP